MTVQCTEYDKLLQRKPYERKMLGKTSVMYKDNDKSKTSIKNSSLYQTNRQTVVKKNKPQIGASHRKHVVNPRPQTPRESVGKPETFLLIILSLVCK